MNSFKKRLNILEARLGQEFIALTLSNDTTKRIPGGNKLLHYLAEIISGKRDTEEINAILNSSSSDEDGHLVDLCRAISKGPAENLR